MVPPVDDQVVAFFSDLFDSLFTKRFVHEISGLRKQKAFFSEISSSADSASQSLSLYLRNLQVSPEQTSNILQGLAHLADHLDLDILANAYITPESVVADLRPLLPCPVAVSTTKQESIFGIALHSTIQVLMLVAPVMKEWGRVGFASTFQLPRLVSNRLNEISRQLQAMADGGTTAGDENFEIIYRNYLMQRFHRVEAGTVRMTTSLNVELTELFVMPRILARPKPDEQTCAKDEQTEELLNLTKAREIYRTRTAEAKSKSDAEALEDAGTDALEFVKSNARTVIVGLPGSGKSTFLEWLQLRIASAEELFVLGQQQAIPVLLHLRNLDCAVPPMGSALIAQATSSADTAAVMPEGWIERQMGAGRVLFMLDGLDETEPGLRDTCVLPWFAGICRRYPDCGYIVSSRPVGYPPGALQEFNFVEGDLQDFDQDQIKTYVRHWCTSVLLAQNTPREEAEREGESQSSKIVQGFRDHPYIPNLARNPLMLSAICLVNYFEGGTLPQDRVILYRLCVEGLLHHWDQRRGICSEFGLSEKLRVCREVAIAMQADDRAEYEAEKVEAVFAQVMGNPLRAKKLLEHIRYRTGLLLERRAGAFAFAHLTFQEYLAALAVHEGNQRNVTAEQLVREHEDGRWKEVMALYCGLAPVPAAREIIHGLMAQEDTRTLGAVLADVYFAARREIAEDNHLRSEVLERIAVSPSGKNPSSEALFLFSGEDVAHIANATLGCVKGSLRLSNAYRWLYSNRSRIDWPRVFVRMTEWRTLTPFQLCEYVALLHRSGSAEILIRFATEFKDVYASPGPDFRGVWCFGSQGMVALNAMPRNGQAGIEAWYTCLRTCMTALLDRVGQLDFEPEFVLILCAERLLEIPPPRTRELRTELSRLLRLMAEKAPAAKGHLAKAAAHVGGRRKKGNKE